MICVMDCWCIPRCRGLVVRDLIHLRVSNTEGLRANQAARSYPFLLFLGKLNNSDVRIGTTKIAIVVSENA